MKNLKTKGKSKWKKIVIILVIILAVIGGLIFTGVRKASKAINEVMNATQTDVVTRRSLVDSVGATGTIVSVDKKNISVNLSGVKLSEVNVEVGDSVSKGDQLAVFDMSDVEEELADAKSSLNRTQQQNSLSTDSSSQNVTDAERNQDYAIANAKDTLDQAQKTYDDAVEDLAAINDVIGNADFYGVSDNLYYYEKKRDAQEDVVDQAKTALESAQRAYDNTIASQESSVNSALNQQSSTALSQDTTTQKRQIENYEEQIADGTLYAPFDGIITAVNYEEGDYYTAGTTVLTIQDCSSYEITTEIDEYSISDIEVGQEVLIKTNATGDEEMTGEVTKVSPVATTASSTVSAATSASSTPTYTVRISIDNPSDRLRLDMSASLSIIIAEHEDALTVPYNAVQTDEDGNTYVLKSTGLASGDAGAMNFEKVPVTVVMESSYYTEISSDGLKEGDTVQIIDTTDYTDLMSMMTEGAGGF